MQQRLFVVNRKIANTALGRDVYTALENYLKETGENAFANIKTGRITIRNAQKALINNTWNAHTGVDTDLLLNELDRFDNCHFSATGQEKFAKEWLELLAKP